MATGGARRITYLHEKAESSGLVTGSVDLLTFQVGLPSWHACAGHASVQCTLCTHPYCPGGCGALCCAHARPVWARPCITIAAAAVAAQWLSTTHELKL